MKGKSRSILFDKEYKGSFTIVPYGSEFIEIKQDVKKTLPKREFKKNIKSIMIKNKTLS